MTFEQWYAQRHSETYKKAISDTSEMAAGRRMREAKHVWDAAQRAQRETDVLIAARYAQGYDIQGEEQRTSAAIAIRDEIGKGAQT